MGFISRGSLTAWPTWELEYNPSQHERRHRPCKRMRMYVEWLSCKYYQQMATDFPMPPRNGSQVILTMATMYILIFRILKIIYIFQIKIYYHLLFILFIFFYKWKNTFNKEMIYLFYIFYTCSGNSCING